MSSLLTPAIFFQITSHHYTEFPNHCSHASYNGAWITSCICFRLPDNVGGVLFKSSPPPYDSRTVQSIL